MTILQNTPEDVAMDTVPRRSGGHRSVLGRAAVVIDAFDDGRALSLDDLTARTGLPRSTVYRLAEQLRDVGWIERVSAGYRIGLRLFEVGGLAADATRLRTQACTWLFQAQQQCARSCTWASWTATRSSISIRSARHAVTYQRVSVAVCRLLDRGWPCNAVRAAGGGVAAHPR